jgi:hypothetical protein
VTERGAVRLRVLPTTIISTVGDAAAALAAATSGAATASRAMEARILIAP